MMLFSRMRLSGLTAALLFPALLAGCADQKQPTQFAPLRYDNLSQINLNVNTLTLVDNTATLPVAGDIGYKSPTPPVQALRQMVQDRLAAKGGITSANSAQFVIDRASILHEPGGTLQGQIDVHLDILNPDGSKTAHTEAHATQSLHPDPTEDTESQANLYNVTKGMMDSINTELDTQVHRALGKWLVDAGGMPVDGAIQAQPLTSDGSPAPATTGAGAAATQEALSPVSAAKTGQATSPVTVPENAPVVAPSTDAATPSTTSSTEAKPAATSKTQDSEPNAIFPAGEDDDSSSSSSSTKATSPKPGYLKLPSQPQ
ncbi:hypothetical protein APS_0293 [Acetobacter pasteurianus subsp. pasteurianus LMG 1262 = NBRC 106471]|nr:hypothetical protein APS_0293 [Acetobacter pasteurianus subsp. pasteurianus LMG 1262 = NBRC 106471]GCD49123.1 hypothetical protein NBRC106471_0679 [Acetobacter pasteurianus subsp. pasteurianus LMG 1262 = NBRC 106471]